MSEPQKNKFAGTASTLLPLPKRVQRARAQAKLTTKEKQAAFAAYRAASMAKQKRKPKTKLEIAREQAEGRRKGWTDKIPGLSSLIDALTPKKGK